MAWTNPVTAVVNQILSAAFWNTNVRDNLLETAPAKATAAGQLFQATGPNAIAALTPVALRMPRSNAAATLMEYVAGINLAQPPVVVNGSGNSGGSLTDVISQSFTTHGGLVILVAFAAINELKSTSNPWQHFYDLYRDTTQLRERIASSSPGAQAVDSNAGFIFAETPAAGTYAYKVKTKYTTGFGTSGTPTATADLLIVELAP